MSESLLNQILEIFYILIGLQLLYTAGRVLKAKKHKKKIRGRHYFGYY
ncbi:membrane protein [Staphylococcus gallinarum]|uniref:Membrane protein n=1 Tax=Staphylococcus gallinarum TaxID=1293 RepID=A0A380FN79_STAGA|nr:membrane protein [Staphylococcus gallinarum]